MCLIDVIPPKSATVMTLVELKERILVHAAFHRQLPTDLKQLPCDKVESLLGKGIKDGWGYPIHYSIDKDGIVTLSSLGKDGRPGGTGDATDLVGTFSAKEGDGSWSEVPTEWLQYPDPGERSMETESAIMDLKEDILRYAREHSALPTGLAQLPSRSRHPRRDGWGRPLQYSVTQDGNVTIENAKGDVPPGAESFVHRFQPKRADGSWLSPGGEDFYTQGSWEWHGQVK